MRNAIKSLRRRGKHLFDTVTNEKVRANMLEAVPFWVASLLTGLFAVAYSKIFSYSETLLQHALDWHRWLIFILAPVNFVIAWYIVSRFAPNAKGSGIPQVMAAIDLSSPRHEKIVSKLLSFRIIVTKIVSSVFMVLGGGAIGREGPTIQIAGSVFRMVSKWTPKSWPRLSQKSFILTGAAAGLAAAFNTPLGGIVFAIEELAQIHLSFFRTALFTAVIIAGLVAQGFLGPYLYLGYPDVQGLKPVMFAGVIFAAVITGILGSLMCKLILAGVKWKQSFGKIKSVIYAVCAGLAVAFIAYYINDSILGSGKIIMNETLFSQQKNVPWQAVVARIIGPVLSYNTGGAGGVFAPALSAGASIGAFLSEAFGVIGANANILILSGMVGFLTGVTRTPFTSAILVLEMTDRHSVIFHLMLAAMVANIAALLIDKHSFYEQLKKVYIDEAREGK